MRLRSFISAWARRNVRLMSWNALIKTATPIIFSSSRSIHCSTIFAAIRASKHSCRRLPAGNSFVKPGFPDRTKPMPSEQSFDVKLEIGHVLFIDIVGYSQLLITQQSEQIDTLRKIVRGTAQFEAAEAEGKLLRLPTGDGGALVFRNNPEAPVLCALEISKELKNHPELKVRMGIHSGPVNEITDLNEQANIAGAGINIAQRVMDCGDAGHILLSRRVAEDLEHYERWQPYLHDLGECEVKHGAHVHLFNLYKDELGNPQPPEAIKRQRLEQAVPTVPSQKTPLLR